VKLDYALVLECSFVRVYVKSFITHPREHKTALAAEEAKRAQNLAAPRALARAYLNAAEIFLIKMSFALK
jgi:hypothetical protein